MVPAFVGSNPTVPAIFLEVHNMEQIFHGEARTELGKGATGRLKRSGRIPAVLYGQKDTVPFSLDSRSFHKDIHGVSESTIVTIKIGGDEYHALIKDYQHEVLTDTITHVDFYEVEKGKVLRTNIPLHLEGVAPGIKQGGILDHLLHDIEVECLPKDIPEAITVDVSTLNLGDILRVEDLKLSSAIKVLTDTDRTVVNIVAPKAEVEAPAEGDEAEEATEANA